MTNKCNEEQQMDTQYMSIYKKGSVVICQHWSGD